VLNTSEDKRLKKRDEHLDEFPYVNGKLFDETLPPAAFDTAMRQALLDCCALDWSRISPAIFGSLFQSVMDPKARRNLGAHYTEEKNILKLIKPLFLDNLWAEYERLASLKRNEKQLVEFHQRLAKLKFFDPACGCGNFLVIAYRELRLLELEILRALHKKKKTGFLSISDIIWLDVDQFYGIEIEEFPAQIAQVALWMTDHQMNMRVSEEFGMYFRRLPLKKAPNIMQGNALRLDWKTIAPNADYILGNPPFVGHQNRTEEQVSDMDSIWGTNGRFGRLDYVTCWHQKSVDFMKVNNAVITALVSTNSICQGEQVGTLWSYLLDQGAIIHFTHRTFQWSSAARGKAAVHCVIVGFALRNAPKKTIFEYEDVKGDPHAIPASNINPYLVDAPNIILPSRSAPRSNLPQLMKGSQPTDGGNLLLSTQEKNSLIRLEPKATGWIKRFMGGEELLHNQERWCLWLKGISPSELSAMPEVKRRVEEVALARAKSKTASVREFATMPTIFTQDRQPSEHYLALSRHSSESRRFIPIGFLSPDIIAGDALVICPGAKMIHFGVMCSTMHNAWARHVCGRLESRLRYEASIYNNFPWPEPSDKQRRVIETAAQSVLDARAKFPDSTLADLYDPLTMPPELTKAHQVLDKVVDAAYGRKKFTSEAERVAFLFERYQALLAPLMKPEKNPRKRKKV
jgi:hypothetical protein